jgi:hypothetical protein
MATALGFVIFDDAKRVRLYGLALDASFAFLQWPLWSFDSIHPALSLWFWKLILLPTGIEMPLIPLLETIRTAQPWSRRG